MNKISISLTTGLSPPETVGRSIQNIIPIDQWHEHFLNDVYAYARRRVATREEAEDITAEVFAALFRPGVRLPDDGCVCPLIYLFGIARRKVADVNRKRRWREIPLSQLFRRQSPEESVFEKPASNHLPETSLLLTERGREIRTLLATLKAEQREALLLHYVEGLSIAETAVVIQKSPAAVNSLLQRGRETLYKRGKAYFLNEEAS